MPSVSILGTNRKWVKRVSEEKPNDYRTLNTLQQPQLCFRLILEDVIDLINLPKDSETVWCKPKWPHVSNCWGSHQTFYVVIVSLDPHLDSVMRMTHTPGNWTRKPVLSTRSQAALGSYLGWKVWVIFGEYFPVLLNGRINSNDIHLSVTKNYRYL